MLIFVADYKPLVEDESNILQRSRLTFLQPLHTLSSTALSDLWQSQQPFLESVVAAASLEFPAASSSAVQ